jgi:hypothetical protein
MTGQTIYHAVHRNLKHMSVVACISAAGEQMTPFLGCPQGNTVVVRKLIIEGFRMGVDLILKSRYKPYMNSQLFTDAFQRFSFHTSTNYGRMKNSQIKKLFCSWIIVPFMYRRRHCKRSQITG